VQWIQPSQLHARWKLQLDEQLDLVRPYVGGGGDLVRIVRDGSGSKPREQADQNLGSHSFSQFTKSREHSKLTISASEWRTNFITAE
jgi:hypothetical protein